MEDRAVIKRDAVFLGVGDGTGPVLRAFGQADKIGHADGRLLGKQGAGQGAGRGVNDGGRSRTGRRSGCRFGGWLRGRRGLRPGDEGPEENHPNNDERCAH